MTSSPQSPAISITASTLGDPHETNQNVIWLIDAHAQFPFDFLKEKAIMVRNGIEYEANAYVYADHKIYNTYKTQDSGAACIYIARIHINGGFIFMLP